jgi:glucokinase
MEEMKIKTRVFGVDLSLEVTTYAIVNIRGKVIAKDSFATLDYDDINDFVSALYDRLIRMAEENGGLELIRSIGISAPSANFKTGCIENASNLPWKGVVPLAAMLRDRLGLAVAVGNDGHVTALGEMTYGSAHGMKNFIVMTFTHAGVGSSIFISGRPHLGANGFAGEIGHTCIVPDGRQCGCGSRGCLETYVSVYGMVQTARDLLKESDVPSLMRNIENINVQSLLFCCQKGDAIALEAVRRSGVILGRALANYASILNPEAIILTGDILQFVEWLMPSVRQTIEENVFHNLRGRVRILASILDEENRTLLGASALAWDVKEYSLFK